MESCSHKYNTSQFFSLIKDLSGKRTNACPNQPLIFNNNILTRDGDIARAFNVQFSSLVPTALTLKPAESKNNCSAHTP